MDQVLVSADDHIRYCAGCARQQQFEQPPCEDGHSADCPERACVVCGHAILVGAAPAAVPPAGVGADRPVTVVTVTARRGAGRSDSRAVA